jgi:GTP cyclohydrolase I
MVVLLFMDVVGRFASAGACFLRRKKSRSGDANLRMSASSPASHALLTAVPCADVNLAAAERASAALLRALGADVADESLRDTPRRMARAYAELLTAEPFTLTTFPNDGGYDEMVVARAIPFHSLCEHHLLPFVGVAHVAYLPETRIVGLSKLARVVEHHARSLQVQERLTTQVCDLLERELRPKGVGVVLEAEHLCMSLRGIQKQGTRTVTSALRGLIRDDGRTRQEFLALAHA